MHDAKPTAPTTSMPLPTARESFEALDWASTPLGRRDTWPEALRIQVQSVMNNPHPMMLMWGEEFIQIYNESYISVLGDKHPGAMGQRVRDCWSETWPLIKTSFEESLHQSRPQSVRDERFLIVRHGFIEEAYFSYTLTPMNGGERTEGVLLTITETTREVLTRRRLSLLTELGKAAGRALTLEEVCKACAEVLSAHEDDLPAVVCYLREDEDANRLRVLGAVGVAPGSEPSPCSMPCCGLEEVLHTGDPAVVEDLERFGLSFIQEHRSSPPTAGIIHPLRALPERPPEGVVLFALHPYRIVDEAYEGFLRLVAQHIAISINRARAYETESKEREKAKDELARIEESYEFLANALPLHVWFADPEGNIEYVNQKIVDYFGRSLQAFHGWNWTGAIHPEDLPKAVARWKTAIETGALYEVEYRLCRTDGTWRWHLARALPQRDDEGRIIRWFGTTTDIEDQRRTEEALREAERLAKLRSSLLANMSHEIRTPLTSMVAEASLLAEQVPPEVKEPVERITTAGLRLADTLNSVLLLAQIEAGALTPEISAVDVAEEVRAALGSVAHLAKTKNIALEIDLESAPATAQLDSTFLRRILINIAGNAIKFTEEGCVRVVARANGGMLELIVSDTGIGIEEAFLPELFDEFKQESTGLARSHEGTGLGLAITRRLIEVLGGTIAVESSKGIGTTFTVGLPLTQDHGLFLTETAVVPAEGSSPDEPFVPVKKAVEADAEPRLLLIEDNGDIRNLISRLLEHVGAVEAFADAESALAGAAASHYDLVLMDISLPTMSGVEALEELRKLPGYRTIPVIALTGHAIPGDRERFLDMGFDHYIAKPFAPDELIRTVQAWAH